VVGDAESKDTGITQWRDSEVGFDAKLQGSFTQRRNDATKTQTIW
jgi:hypothetical protein